MFTTEINDQCYSLLERNSFGCMIDIEAGREYQQYVCKTTNYAGHFKVLSLKLS